MVVKIYSVVFVLKIQILGPYDAFIYLIVHLWLYASHNLGLK